MDQFQDEQFRDFVTNVLGFVILEIPPNGNSIFAALSLGLFNDATQDHVVRMTTHYYVMHHWDQFTEFFITNAAMEAAVAGLLVNLAPVPANAIRFVLRGISLAFGVNVVLWNYAGAITEFAHTFEIDINISRHPCGHYNFMFPEQALPFAGPGAGPEAEQEDE